ncbi:hypothetical protein ACIRD2_03225 [Streptomyces sp. NPDC093595]|uniref:hypothetical protein n=1 Tax=Streptomyces sp. NPDC093595 TaxID=3366045 RepID=UPI00380215F1
MAKAHLTITVDTRPAVELGTRVKDAVLDTLTAARATSQTLDDDTLAGLAASAVIAELLRIVPSSSAAAEDRARRAAATVREWLPALRRAVDCLDTTCRYHGDQLDPDHFGRMTRSEACCDTGIEPRRAREARAALAALTRLTEEQP